MHSIIVRQTTPLKWAKDLNRYSIKERIQMANKHLKRHASLLVIREMQIRITRSRDFRSTTSATVSKLSIASVDKDPEQLGHSRVAGRNAE